MLRDRQVDEKGSNSDTTHMEAIFMIFSDG